MSAAPLPPQEPSVTTDPPKGDLATPDLATVDFVGDLFARLAPRRTHSALSWLLAILSHGAIGLFALAHPAQAEMAREPLEVELFTPPPPPPPPPPEPEPEAKAAAPEPMPTKAPPPKPPAAAKAGAVLTANPEPTPASAEEEPFDFTSDPNSNVYGAGVVAVGGTATYGVAGAKVDGVGSTPITAAPVVGDGLTDSADLSRQPGMKADACRGFFPAGALDEEADVTLSVVVSKIGTASKVKVLKESKPRQGFGAAAVKCLQERGFSAGLDKNGDPAATSVKVNVHFSLR